MSNVLRNRTTVPAGASVSRLLQFLPRFRRAQKELGVLAERERWHRDEITRYQLYRLNRVWAHAIAHVPYYRSLAASQSPTQRIQRFDSLQEFQATVPLLSKEVVQVRRGEFLSERLESGGHHFTGGSTGTPCPFYHSKQAHLETLRSRYRFHQMWGIALDARWAFLWGHALSRPSGFAGTLKGLRQPIWDALRNRLRLSAYRTRPEDLREHLSRMAAFKPAAIYAYSTAAYLLAREAIASRFRCDSLKLIVLTSEPAYPHIRRTCEQAFGVPAVVEYVAAECSILAVEWPDRTIRVREDNVLMETLPREDGRFDIVISVLNNPSFPLLRYAIGDVTASPIDRPERGFAILENVGGRSNDLILSSANQPLHGTLFEWIFEEFADIRRYRMHQQNDGSITVNLELNVHSGESVLEKLKTTLAETIGFPVNIEVVDSIASNAAGKHRWITSDFQLQSAGFQQLESTASWSPQV